MADAKSANQSIYEYMRTFTASGSQSYESPSLYLFNSLPLSDECAHAGIHA